MTLLLTSGSNHTIHIFVEHTAPHRRGGANQNDHRPHPKGGGGDKARNDDITTNKRQQPYHTSVERGGANQKDHRPHSTRGGGRGDEAKQDQTGKATRPNKTTTHLTGKGGYHGAGGCGSPASYISTRSDSGLLEDLAILWVPGSPSRIGYSAETSVQGIFPEHLGCQPPTLSILFG